MNNPCFGKEILILFPFIDFVFTTVDRFPGGKPIGNDNIEKTL